MVLNPFLNRSTSFKAKATKASAAPAETEIASIDVRTTFRCGGSRETLTQYGTAALVFAYIERIFGQEDRKKAVEASIATLEAFLPKLRQVGFEEMVIDDSYEIPRDLINGIVDSEPVSNNGTTLTRAQLLEVFQDDSSTWSSTFASGDEEPARLPPPFPPTVSNYLVTFLRMITSAQIRGNPNDFEPFLMHPDTGEKMGSKEFCESLVEVLGKEAGKQSVPFFPSSQSRLMTPFPFTARADKNNPLSRKLSRGIFFALTDHVQLTAITQALQVNVKIAYLDGRSQDGRVEFVTFNHAKDENDLPLMLLYR